jgi:hypothetical protein
MDFAVDHQDFCDGGATGNPLNTWNKIDGPSEFYPSIQPFIAFRNFPRSENATIRNRIRDGTSALTGLQLAQLTEQPELILVG